MIERAAPTLNESMKMIALNLMGSMQLADVTFGEVTKVNPLEITIDQKNILTGNYIVLTNMVKDHTVDVTVSMETENDSYMTSSHTHTGDSGGKTDSGNLNTTHHHDIKGRKKITLHYGLTLGERVVLVKMQGGQRYVVIDRIDSAKTEGQWIDE